MNKTVITMVAAVIIAGVGGFFAGMKYDQSKTLADRQARAQQFGGAAGAGGQRGAGVRASGGGLFAGEILSKDEKSITVKLRDGGSKIIFFSDSTQIMKTAAGLLGDLKIGEQVTANGTANSDGSITAQTIQIRPAMPASQ